MRQFYRAPTATLQATPPEAIWHGIPCPGAPAWSLIVVECWCSSGAEDAWEILPGVIEFYRENLSQLAPPALVVAFAPWGVATGDTIRDALKKIRTSWPAARA